MNRATRRSQAKQTRRAPRHVALAHKASSTYTALDITLASPHPMPTLQREAYIAGFKAALYAIQFGAESTPQHWIIMADAVNLCETFCVHAWPDPAELGSLIDIADESGALQSASEAMKEAARIHRMQGGSIRLSADGRQALADLVDLLDTILQTVSHRSALQCHNECEKAIRLHRARNSAAVITL